MCTAVTYRTKDFYFGRTLDYDFSYGEEVVITPRNYPFLFRHTKVLNTHYAMIGMAHTDDGYPLYYDAVNEKGLGMAGLNFVGNADYKKEKDGADNIAQFELIQWILGQCATVKEARKLLAGINITGTPFNDNLPAARIHFIIADRNEAITVESIKEGLKVYDNPVGVMTNDPQFPEQMLNLNNYMSLSPKSPVNNFSDKLNLSAYSRGMGAIGLPGDLSSQSRFVRAAFVKMNSVSGDCESESISQFFHIMGAVDQQRGCCILDNGNYEITIYTSCCNADKGIYYYTTYGNHQITSVNMHKENLDSAELIKYPLVQGEQIREEN